MARRRALTLGLAAGAVLCVAAASLSQLCWPAVVDQGGGVAYSSSYQMKGSVGGPVIVGAAEPGTASSANYKFEVNTIAVLETGAKEEPAPDGNGEGGGCGAGAALIVGLALGWTSSRFTRGAFRPGSSQRPPRRGRGPSGR